MSTIPIGDRKRTFGRKKAFRPIPKKEQEMRHIAKDVVERKLRNAIETKSHTINGDYANVDATTGFVASLTEGIVQAVSDVDYIGNVITPVNLVVRYIVTKSTTTEDYNMMRVMVVQDRTSGVPTIANVFASAGNSRTPLSPLDIDFDNTYTVLYDRMHILSGTSGDASNENQLGRIVIPGKRLRKIYFNDAAGSLERGGLYLICVSDSTEGGVTGHPDIAFISRLYYKDA